MQTWISQVCEIPVLLRAVKIALLVGTLLMIINHGDRILTGAMAPEHWLKVLLSYFVPYFVSTYSNVVTCSAEKNR
jgi:hypothetical protein